MTIKFLQLKTKHFWRTAKMYRNDKNRKCLHYLCENVFNYIIIHVNEQKYQDFLTYNYSIIPLMCIFRRIFV